MKRLGIIIVLVLYLVGCAISQHYTAHGTVVEVEADVVTVAFPNGNEFSFYGDGFSVGDKVTLKMNTSGTDDYVSDDFVEHVIN